MDYQITHLDGRVLHLNCINTVLSQDERGQVVQRIIFDISRRVELENRLKRMSYEDSLTGLFNRNMYNLIIDTSRPGSATRLGVACLDLNGLKSVNDRLGHSAGDELLRRTGAHIRRRFGGRAYRIGGDEFVIIDDTLTETAFRTAMAGLVQAMASDGISVSVGLCWRDRLCSVKDQMEEADRQMYRDKHQFYSRQPLPAP